MIDREHDLSITKQAEVLKISRGSVYYLPRLVSSADLAIMRRLDQLHLEFPFAGSRMFFRGCAHQGGIAERKAMIDREHDLSITKQAEVLEISRGNVYLLPRLRSSA